MTSNHTNTMKGYNVASSDRDALAKKFLCGICKEILRDPLRTVCGHRFCKSCYTANQDANGSFTCPTDGTTLTQSETHSSSCPVSTIQCPNTECTEQIKQSELHHHEKECKFSCIFCHERIIGRDMDHHHKVECESFPVRCSKCGKGGMKRGQLKKHCLDGSCKGKNSLFPTVGCKEKVMKRFKAVKGHEEVKRGEVKRDEEICGVFHLRMLLAFALRLEEKVQSAMSCEKPQSSLLFGDYHSQLVEEMSRMRRVFEEMKDARLKLKEKRMKLESLNTRFVGCKNSNAGPKVSSLFQSLSSCDECGNLLDKLSRKLTSLEDYIKKVESHTCEVTQNQSNSLKELKRGMLDLTQLFRDTLHQVTKAVENVGQKICEATQMGCVDDVSEYQGAESVSKGEELQPLHDYAAHDTSQEMMPDLQKDELKHRVTNLENRTADNSRNMEDIDQQLPLSTSLNELKRKMMNLESRTARSEQQIMNLENRTADNSWNVEGIKQQLARSEQQALEEAREATRQIERAIKVHRNSNPGEGDAAEQDCPFKCFGCEQTAAMDVQSLLQHIKVHNTAHVLLLRLEILRSQTTAGEIDKLPGPVCGLQDRMEATEREIKRADQVTRFDGVLTWKISNFAQKRASAVAGRESSFHSPCFYTSPSGYRMCMRIHLNGCGIGEGTHISVFFVVMQGEYDALLRWPFRRNVTIMLLDQDHMEHVIGTIKPNPNSPSFQRPRGEMNIASGCPLFFSLGELNKHAYMRENTMFIKVSVDTSDC